MEKSIIIAISGKLGSGKDSVAEIIKKHSKYPFKQTAFAKKLKEVVALLASVPYETTLTQEGKNLYIKEYDKTIGEMLQQIGTNCMRDNFDKNVWINACLLEIKNNPGNYLITDCRFDNEADAIKKAGGIVIRVNRPNNPIAKASGRDLNHPSETGLDDYLYFDWILNNTGTLENLEYQVLYALKKIEEAYAEKEVSNIVSKYKEEIKFDEITGEIKLDSKNIPIDRDIFLPSPKKDDN